MKADAIRFNSIIKITGLNPEDYPVASKIEVDVFDLKKCKLDEYQILEYGNDLFENNPNSKVRFQELSKELETTNERPARMEAMLMDAFLLIKTSPISMEYMTFPRY